MYSLRGQKVVVVGLGKSGRGAVELALQRGASVTVVDEQAREALPEELSSRGVSLRAGPLSPEAFAGAELVVVSPGVPWNRPELVALRQAGTRVVGEVELAFTQLRPDAGPVLAVTGTNGKSTTTALLGVLLEHGGRSTFTGGNLGRPFSEAALRSYQVHALEVSSFQLEGIATASFLGGAILNLTPDHLDRYPDMAAYGAAKARIFANPHPKGFGVLNAMDPLCLPLGEKARVPLYGFLRGEVGGPALPAPRLEGLAVSAGDRFEFDFGARPHFFVRNRALRGAHNLQNAMAAALLAYLGGVEDKAIQLGLDAFPGLPHRMEVVRELDGVEWINDSKATNVDSAVVALQALDAPLWLIAGGKGKGAPYRPLVEAARGKLKGLLTVGQDAPALEEAFRGATQVHGCGTLDRAVSLARELAEKGDVVLLSPACASYDQFQHFEHRGDTFKTLVRRLM